MTQTRSQSAARKRIAPHWRLTGARPGPVLLVTGSGKALQGAVARLQNLPSLGYLRGELRVQPRRSQHRDPVDLHLPLVAQSEADAYWSILSAAAKLGMISGRGVPAKYREPLEQTRVAA